MVSAVALSSAISSVGFDADVSFDGPGAARRTLMLVTDSNVKIIAPSRNPNRFFMNSLPLAPGFNPNGFSRCYRENARPARTCREFMIVANACGRSLRHIHTDRAKARFLQYA